MTATYRDGWNVGTERARADLVDHRNIAARWAKATLIVLQGRVPQDEYERGVLDGYRDMLNHAAQT